MSAGGRSWKNSTGTISSDASQHCPTKETSLKFPFGRKSDNKIEPGEPDSPAVLISAFTSGRVSYDQMSEQLAALAEAAGDMSMSIRGAIRGAEEAGRLPADLAAILLNVLPAPNVPGHDAEIVELHVADLNPDEDDLFEEPTVPLLKKAVEPPPPAAPVNASSLPPLPQAPMAIPAVPAAAVPDHAQAKGRVDDAVLSSLIGDYRDLRKGRQTAVAADQQKPDALDGLLGNFKSARFRSDARRAGRGAAAEGLKLNKLDDFHGKRAGIGSILRERFILDREIGRGGMGVVYAAVDRRRLEAASGQPYVALKLLNDDFRTNSEALRSLEAEARKTQSLAHPNITTVYDFDRDRSEIFIVMELLTGMPLSRLLSTMVGQALPGGQISNILHGIGAGLAYAHQRGVVHSDLKPGNVFVLDTGEIKLLDFGLATAAQAADLSGVSGLTATYASPEMFDGAPRDPRDDIFALGCIAYQLLTGLHPFGMQPIDEAAKAGRKPAPIDDLDPAAWQVIDRALAFDREARIGSVEEFVAGLFEV